MDKDSTVRIGEMVVGPLATNCYLLSCRKTMKTVIIDPGGDAGKITDHISAEKILPVKILLTHGHSDHMAAAAELSRSYGIDIYIHEKDVETMKKSIEDAPMWGLGNIEAPDSVMTLSSDNTIKFGDLEGRIIDTPGHTLGGISLYIDGVVFVGDTLFARSIGRTDFFGGDMNTLLESIRTNLFSLPDKTIVFCGHGPSTSIAVEKAQNPFLNGLI
ncbi:MAG: MBL fold metallo-hydrolase [Candidatus Krumholzibacteriota bacterium]|nr:MBL fold metallo-hydrolase [Candidatus Krumholzibacteriota bacterium]